MKRKRSQSTSRNGINFVRNIVERQNSTFQEIALHNDLGNDAYIEFVVEENSTGCCIALQIKSGTSYRTTSGQYAFQADREHFEYWASHTLPVLAVIFDPEKEKAVWTDITDYLRLNPSLITTGPYRISAGHDFSVSTFSIFRSHCLGYRDSYSREQNLGRALESFSRRDDTGRCFDGLRALFAYHRHQPTTWYYLISCISNYKEHPILPSLILRLCHVPGHGDIFWGKENIIDEEVRRTALLFMKERFDRKDALTLLSVIDESGIDRGTIGQCVHALVDTMSNTADIMESIAIDDSQDIRTRHSAILFAVSAAQSQGKENAIKLLKRIHPSIKSDFSDVADWLEGSLREYGYVSLY